MKGAGRRRETGDGWHGTQTRRAHLLGAAVDGSCGIASIGSVRLAGRALLVRRAARRVAQELVGARDHAIDGPRVRRVRVVECGRRVLHEVAVRRAHEHCLRLRLELDDRLVLVLVLVIGLLAARVRGRRRAAPAARTHTPLVVLRARVERRERTVRESLVLQRAALVAAALLIADADADAVALRGLLELLLMLLQVTAVRRLRRLCGQRAVRTRIGMRPTRRDERAGRLANQRSGARLRLVLVGRVGVARVGHLVQTAGLLQLRLRRGQRLLRAGGRVGAALPRDGTARLRLGRHLRSGLLALAAALELLIPDHLRARPKRRGSTRRRRRRR